MKTKFLALAILIIALAIPTKTVAQFEDLIYKSDKRINPEDRNQLTLGIDNMDFFRNNEYQGDRSDGYSLPGFWIRPTIGYQPLRNLKIDFGFHMLVYWGASSYTRYEFTDVARQIVAANGKRAHILPFLRVQAALSPTVNLVMGNIYGGKDHDLPEIFYDEEKALTQNPEAGFQILWNTDYFDLDAWVNWESFIFRNANHQEAFTAGLALCAKANKAASRFHLYFPLNAVFQHRGGEIDTVPSNRVQTWLNASAGAGLDINLRNRTVSKLNLEVTAAAFSQQAGSILPFDKGAAVYAHAYADIWRFRIGAGYWYGKNFISLLGNPHYGNIGIPYEGIRFDEAALGTIKVEYSQKLGHGYAWGAKVQMWSMGSCDIHEAGNAHIEPSAISYYYGVFFRVNPQFLLKDFTKK